MSHPRRRIALNRAIGLTNALFIVGSGRSGTTLLRRLLLEQTKIYIPPETYVLGQILRQFSVARQLPWRDFVTYVVARFEYEPEFARFEIGSLRPFVRRMLDTPSEDRALEFLLDALYRHFSEEAGYPSTHWGDKTPYNTFFLPEIARTFPGARFVNMQRDGCDVVVSYVRAGIYPDYLSAARRWIDSVKLLKAFGRKYGNRMMTLRYEDLIQDPERYVGEVAKFARIAPRPSGRPIDLSDAMRDVNRMKHLEKALTPVDAGNSGRGRAALRQGGSEAVRQMLNPVLRELGYNDL